MEETIARAYSQAANLRAVTLKSGCPEVIQHSRHIFEKLLNSQLRDSLVTDIHAISGAENTEGDIFENVTEPHARPVDTRSSSLPSQHRLYHTISRIDTHSSCLLA